MEFIYHDRVELLPRLPGYQNGPPVKLARLPTLLDFPACRPIEFVQLLQILLPL